MVIWIYIVIIGKKMKNNMVSNQIKIKGVSSFLENKSDINNSIFIFIYKIKIKNESDSQIKLLSRHWDIKDANGKIDIVDGEGVVGENPVLNPGDMYEYNSFCPLKTNFGSMKGHYTFIKENNGEIFKSAIPEFSLITPYNIN